MQTFTIPAWVWANLVVLIVAALIVAVKLASERKTERREPKSKPAAPLPSGR